MSLGSYEIVERIGMGGMAEVFRARYQGQAGAQREVVIKRMLPFPEEEKAGLQALFVNEARLTLQLTHGNIVQVFDFGEEDGQYYLVMELVDGVSLAQLLTQLKRKGLATLPPELAALVMIEVAKGLHYAHTRPGPDKQPLHIVHRDISPDNVLVGADGQVKVADFGIARASLAGRARTEPGVFRGKLAYSAPEQLRAESVDGRADVYSCGIVLWKAMTGVHPQGENAFKIAAGQTQLPPVPTDVMGAELAGIIERATAFHPEHRTKSALQLQVELQKWVRQRDMPHLDTAVAQVVVWVTKGPDAVEREFDAWLRDRVTSTQSLVKSSRARATVARRALQPATKRKGVWLGLGAAALALVLTGAVVSGTNEAPPEDLGALRPIELAAPVPLAPKRHVEPAPIAPEPAPLPQSATGTPAAFTLSTAKHGGDLRSAGIEIKAPSPEWAVRLWATPAPRQKKISLFFLPADQTSPQVLGAKWAQTTAATGRLFVFQPPNWSAREVGNPDLHLGAVEGSKFAVVETKRRVLSDAMAFLDEDFRLDGLERKVRYRLTTKGSKPVFVLAELPRYDQVEPVFSIAGPPRQVLVPADGSVEFKGVDALRLVVPREAGEPEERVEVTVIEIDRAGTIKIERGSHEARTLDAQLNKKAATPVQSSGGDESGTAGSGAGRVGLFDTSTAEGNLNAATILVSQKRKQEAVPYLARCLKLDPGNPECDAMLRKIRAP